MYQTNQPKGIFLAHDGSFRIFQEVNADCEKKEKKNRINDEVLWE